MISKINGVLKKKDDFSKISNKGMTKCFDRFQNFFSQTEEKAKKKLFSDKCLFFMTELKKINYLDKINVNKDGFLSQLRIYEYFETVLNMLFREKENLTSLFYDHHEVKTISIFFFFKYYIKDINDFFDEINYFIINPWTLKTLPEKLLD